MVGALAIAMALAIVAAGMTAADTTAKTATMAAAMATTVTTAISAPVASGVGGVHQGCTAGQDGTRRQDHRTGGCGQQGFLLGQFGASTGVVSGLAVRPLSRTQVRRRKTSGELGRCPVGKA
ncbi:hypothetical protein D3C84_915790 [compost metagenome]